LNFEELKKELARQNIDLGGLSASSDVRASNGPVSGKELASRLAGLLSDEQVDELERHINESCEQLDD
jgi:hypothetical protein